MQLLDIVSVPDRLVVNPATGLAIDKTPTPIDPDDPYWARLLRDKDVKAAPDQAAKPKENEK